MSRYVNIIASTHLSTDFYLEVPENASEEEIRQLAEKEVILPHNYHKVVDQMLRRMGIVVKGIDSMLRAWELDNLEYIIDGGNPKAIEGE